METSMKFIRKQGAVVLLLLCVAMFSCKKEEIQTYKAPKDPENQARAAAPQPTTPPAYGENAQRLLGAIAVYKDKTWYFKLVGPVARVTEAADQFHTFVHSLQFSDDPARPVTWQLPEGWKQSPSAGGSLRFATLVPGGGLEVTVIPLEGASGGPQENINRWRGQIGLEPVEDTRELLGFVETHEVNGMLVMEIDMTGPGGSGGPAPNAPLTGNPPPALAAPRAPFAQQGAPIAAGQNLAPVIEQIPEDSPLTFTVPQGWRMHEPSGMRKADLSVAEDTQVAQTTVIPLSGPAGGLLSNVNRWRGQVGLQQVDADQLAREAVEVEVDGIKGHLVDLAAPESAGAERLRILGVILQRGDTSWFIKMTGPHDLVVREKDQFQALVKSIKFKN